MVFFEKNRIPASCRELYGETVGYTVGEDVGILCSEDEAYERLCEVADASVGMPITAVLRFDGAPGEREQTFRSRVRAVYRASVWGQFSLLCAGAAIPEHVHSISEALRDAFCELEIEGREFNGFIKKGILIDTPLLLYRFPLHAKFDFLCIDPERICTMCTGKDLRADCSSEIITDITNLLCTDPSAEAALRISSDARISEICKALPEIKIDRLYVW